MPTVPNVTRRSFIVTTVGICSTAGCLGPRKQRPGVLDASDFSVQSNGSAKATVRNRENDGNKGLKISTEDSVKDGKVAIEAPVSIQNASESSIQIVADVDQLDDDAEVEIRFRSDESSYRSIFIGNEYKTRDSGVLATETGSGFEFKKQLNKLPSPDDDAKIDRIDTIEIEIRDGDFSGTIWSLWFIFEDMTVAVI